jgi:hypothetical protein
MEDSVSVGMYSGVSTVSARGKTIRRQSCDKVRISIGSSEFHVYWPFYWENPDFGVCPFALRSSHPFGTLTLRRTGRRYQKGTENPLDSAAEIGAPAGITYSNCISRYRCCDKLCPINPTLSPQSSLFVGLTKTNVLVVFRWEVLLDV